MEFIIGLIAIVLVYAVYKFMSKVNTTPDVPNAYKFPEEPLTDKDPNQGPDNI